VNIRKKLAILTIVILFSAYIAGAGVALWAYTDYDPMPPEPAVISVSAEPDYLVTIAWRSVASASRYELQYRYGYEEGKTYGIKTNKTSCTVDRIKGNLYFRLRYLYKNGKQYSEYTEWKTYYIEPLFLDVSGVESCDLIETNYWLGDHQLKGVAFEKRDWRDKSPQSFMFRGKKVDIYCYDFVVVFEDSRFEYEKNNMITKWNYNLANGHDGYYTDDIVFVGPLTAAQNGKWTIYYRPSICESFLGGQKNYNKEILKIFDETEVWISSEITINYPYD
jgi:hypothetical protein